MVKHLIRHTRPVNVLIIFLTALLVPWSLAPNIAFLNSVILLSGAIILGLAAAAGYLSNDLLDQHTDRINSKVRAGTIDSGLRLVLRNTVFALYAICVVLTSIVGLQYRAFSLFPLIIVVICLIEFYNRYLKNKPVIGNMTVAITCISPVLLAYLIPDVNNDINGHPWKLTVFWMFLAHAFFLNWLREISKDAEDRAGDAQAGRKTIAVLFGHAGSRLYSLVVLTLFGAALLVICVSREAPLTAMVTGLGIHFLLVALYIVFPVKTNQEAHWKSRKRWLKFSYDIWSDLHFGALTILSFRLCNWIKKSFWQAKVQDVPF